MKEEKREKKLWRIFWFIISYCLMVNFFAAQLVAAKEVSNNQSRSIPSAIVEDLGEGHTSWEYLHASFIIPVRQIVEKARSNMNVAATVTTMFDYHWDHIKGRIEVLNATLLSVDIGESC